MKRHAVVTAILLLAVVAVADPTRFLIWNTESSGSDVATIARQLKELGAHDVWGLVEVASQGKTDYTSAIAEASDATYKGVWADSEDKNLLIVYNSDRFALLGEPGLGLIDISLVTLRPALWVRLQEKGTGNVFVFVLVHLARTKGNEFMRYAQSRALQKWASLPQQSRTSVVIAGDFNYDWNVRTDGQDRGYVLLTEGDLRWIRPPAPLKSTQARCDCVLDFFFFNAKAKESGEWTSTIIERPGDFPDDRTTSDHRPVEATWIPKAPPEDATSGDTSRRGGVLIAP